MKVLEAKIIFEADEIEKYQKIISDIFYDMGVTGLKIEEPNFIKNPLDFYRDEKSFISSENSVSAYFPLNIYTEKRKTFLKEKLEEIFGEDEELIYILDFYEYDEEDYQNSWKKYLFVEHIGSRFVIKPTWRDYEATNDEIMIEIDPGLAFGTGSHPTTALCLRALESMDLANKKVIDIGTGSGILMIACKKLGAATVYGTDIDEASISVSKENLLLNNIEVDDEKIKILKGNLLEVLKADEKFDVVVANILSDVLVKLLKDIKSICKIGTKILFSGIIEDKLEEMKKNILAHNFEIIEISKEKEWQSILFEFRGDL